MEDGNGTPSPKAFEGWLQRQPGWARARVRSLAPVAGGASNITCRVDLIEAPEAAVALRLERARGIFEPYDVLREGDVLRRLAGTGLPVPRLLFAEPDATMLGARFIVEEWIDAPHMGEAGAEASFAAYAAAVVAVHRVNWRAVGLDSLGVPDSPARALEAEVAAIAGRMRAFGCDGDAVLAEARTRIAASVPGDGRLALCQGDINVFNYLFRAGQVVGIVDWEQARISDPRSDIGQLVALAHLKGAPFGPADTAPFVQMYSAVAGEQLRGMSWFRARWLWELGVIAYGWKAFTGGEPWYTREALEELLARSLAEL